VTAGRFWAEAASASAARAVAREQRVFMDGALGRGNAAATAVTP
jgi:hypothetical protein